MPARSLLIPSLFVALFLACGPAGGGGGGGGQNPGFTACGNLGGSPKQCQPGQYCKDEIGSICDNGCLSNGNCAADQECAIPAGESVGACQNKGASSPDGGGQSAELARCLAACEKGASCGYYLPGDVVGCKDGCDKVSDVVRKALADCVATNGCGANLPSCYNASCGSAVTCCGPSYACPSGKTCLGHLCT